MYSALYNMDRNRTCNRAAQITNGCCKFWYRRTPEVKHSALKKQRERQTSDWYQLYKNFWFHVFSKLSFKSNFQYQEYKRWALPAVFLSPPEFNIFQRYLMSNPQSKCLVPICFFEALNTDNFSLIQCFKIQKPGGKITAEKMLLVLLI